jgi:hypothetical protein
MPRRRARPSPPQDNATGRFDHGTTPDPNQEARASDTLAEIRALSRAPFRRILTRYVDAAPDLVALAAQAEKYPDRWAQGLAIAGRLAGYTEKLEVDVTGDVTHVHHLSDLELELRIHELDARLKALGPPLRALPPAPDSPPA